MKQIIFAAILCVAATANAQTAKLEAPEKVAAGSIAVIDMSGSDGDRFEVKITPSVTSDHLARDTGGKRFYFATAVQGQYAIVLTAWKGDRWALATAIITVGNPAAAPPSGLSAITAVSKANVPDGASDAEKAKQRKWFTDAAAKFKADNMKSKQVNEYTAAAAKDWSQPWRDHFNSTLPAIERANPVTPEQWSEAYLDIARGIE